MLEHGRDGGRLYTNLVNKQNAADLRRATERHIENLHRGLGHWGEIGLQGQV